MTIFGTTHYGADTFRPQTPLWMKSERYEYCDSFFDSIHAKNTTEKKFSRFNRLLSFFL